MINKTFVSYRADSEGTRYKNLLVAWSNHSTRFPDIKFRDESIGVSINSIDANYIKRRIKEKIESSDVFLCLVGENTHKSDWVNWEIEQAALLNKKIVAVKIKKNYITPEQLYSKKASWAQSFTEESIRKALVS